MQSLLSLSLFNVKEGEVVNNKHNHRSWKRELLSTVLYRFKALTSFSIMKYFSISLNALYELTLGLCVNLLGILRREMVINLEEVSLLRANCRICLKQEFLTSE